MPTTTVPPGYENSFRIDGKDDDSNVRAITGTAVISNTTASYLAKVPGTTNQYCFVARAGTVIPAGSSIDVNVVVTASDDRGNALPPVTIPFSIPGPPLPPPATHVVVSASSTTQNTPPADPGTDTISL